METQASKQDKGFTLVELLIVIVILGILATVTVFAVQGITTRGKATACRADQKTLLTAVEANMADRGTYPASLTELADNGLLADGSISANFEYSGPGEDGAGVDGILGNADDAAAPNGAGYSLSVDPAGECDGVTF